MMENNSHLPFSLSSSNLALQRQLSSTVLISLLTHCVASFLACIGHLYIFLILWSVYSRFFKIDFHKLFIFLGYEICVKYMFSISSQPEICFFFYFVLLKLIIQGKKYFCFHYVTVSSLNMFLIFKNFYWNTVDLQCRVNFSCRAKRFSYVFIHIYLFFYTLFHCRFLQVIE